MRTFAVSIELICLGWARNHAQSYLFYRYLFENLLCSFLISSFIVLFVRMDTSFLIHYPYLYFNVSLFAESKDELHSAKGPNGWSLRDRDNTLKPVLGFVHSYFPFAFQKTPVRGVWHTKDAVNCLFTCAWQFSHSIKYSFCHNCRWSYPCRNYIRPGSEKASRFAQISMKDSKYFGIGQSLEGKTFPLESSCISSIPVCSRV